MNHFGPGRHPEPPRVLLLLLFLLLLSLSQLVLLLFLLLRVRGDARVLSGKAAVPEVLCK